MKKKCPACQTGRLEKADNIVSEIGGYVFAEKGERCPNCGEEFPFEKESQRTIELARRLGVWPEPMTLYRKLSEVGNALVFRIPSDLERQLGLKAGDEVKVTKLGHKIVLEPIQPTGLK